MAQEDEIKLDWKRRGGYECSSKGDTRFSALYARMPDGRTIEQHYQCDIKGYCPGGTDWRLGKGKPSLKDNVDLWANYLNLWMVWGNLNANLIDELIEKSAEYNYVLSDCFASSDINQARALSYVCNKRINQLKFLKPLKEEENLTIKKETTEKKVRKIIWPQ